MPLSKQIVGYVASLSRIEMNAAELEKMSNQLDTIIGFIDELRSCDVNGVEPMPYIVPVNNRFRSDTPSQSLPIEKTLLNAPHGQDRFFAVPRVLE